MLTLRRRFANAVLAVCLAFLLCFLLTHFDLQLLSFKLESKTHPPSANVQDQRKTLLEHSLIVATPEPSIDLLNTPEAVILAPPPTPTTFQKSENVSNPSQNAKVSTDPEGIPLSSARPDTPAEQLFVEAKVLPMIPLPSGIPVAIPKLQHEFGTELPEDKSTRLKRLNAVKFSFTRSWDGYKKHAWMKDELALVDAGHATTFSGWTATLVNSLDTLWILGMVDEFEQAVWEVKNIHFVTSESPLLSLFETTVRYLGGFLGAYDISDGKYPVLLEKATELGEILYTAFDTQNRMPMTHWNFKLGTMDGMKEASGRTFLAELGSLSLEFTRLSQLTGNSKYFDAIQRVTNVFEASQHRTLLPGLWPTVLNAKKLEFYNTRFTLGGMADSMYEYLPKQHLLLGGLTNQYKNLYETAMVPIKKHLFFRPMTPQNVDILMSGSAYSDSSAVIPESQMQHLACFAGGMVAIGAKMFERSDELAIARKLTDGCVWAYNSTQTGIMPEMFRLVSCRDPDQCGWNEERWWRAIVSKPQGNFSAQDRQLAQKTIKELRFPVGFYDVSDRRYQLRPEAIESVFVLYRLTGDPTLREEAWRMFMAIERYTRTSTAYATLRDVTDEGSPKDNRMESYWLAETLKYFALIFSEPNVLSLDEYVL